MQIMMAGWDHHSDIYGPSGLPRSCRFMDRPTAALIHDLKQRGLLDDTLVIWTGEFGRTPMIQAISPQGFTQDPGRDHHKDGFSLILAGGGIRPASRTGRPTSSASSRRCIPFTCMTSTCSEWITPS